MNISIISTPYGRGIQSNKSFSKGDVIFRSPCLRINSQDITDKSIIRAYMFNSDKPGEYLISLDYSSLMNHSKTPNIDYRVVDNKDEIEFIASKDINPNEELTIDYGYDVYVHNKSLRLSTDDMNDLTYFSNLDVVYDYLYRRRKL